MYNKMDKIDKLSSIINEIIQKHVNGIHFREWNAGHQIDSHMTDNGFNVDINFDYNTGNFLRIFYKFT